MMIGKLPTTLEINNNIYKIRTDFRTCLLILQAFNDEELNSLEQRLILLNCLYMDFKDMPDTDYEEAINRGIWFLNCGDTVNKPVSRKPLYDWEQDEQMIFSAVNKVAGKEVRTVPYMHFWTFIGLFNEIGEGMFSFIISIRNKKLKGEKLEKHEKEFYRNNKEIIDLRRRYNAQEKLELQVLDTLLSQ